MIENLKEHIQRTPYVDIISTVGQIADNHGIESYVIGGFVRDLMLGRTTKDIDFVCVGDGKGLELARYVGETLGGQSVHYYPNFGTAAVRIHGKNKDNCIDLEFVGARSESYRRNSRKPIVESGTLEEDQYRRDFTVNAMGFHIAPLRFGEVVDPFNGRKHLQDKILKTPLDPLQTFEDDPLRMLRGARFSAQLNFKIDNEAYEAMHTKAQRVKILSQERIIEEFQKIMLSSKPSVGFKPSLTQASLSYYFPN